MDFRRSLAISFVFHISLIFFTSIHLFLTRQKYIVVPVDLMFYASPTPSTVAEKPSEKDEVVIPPKLSTKKKPKIEKAKKEEVSKSTPRESPPQPIASQPETSASLTPDTAKFPYLYYLRRIRESISRNWGWASSGESDDIGNTLKTVVYFKIQKDGTITQPVFKEKSGYAVFDTLALRAVSNSAPFPPLPSGYEDDSLGVYFEFSYKP